MVPFRQSEASSASTHCFATLSAGPARFRYVTRLLLVRAGHLLPRLSGSDGPGSPSHSMPIMVLAKEPPYIKAIWNISLPHPLLKPLPVLCFAFSVLDLRQALFLLLQTLIF